MYYLALSLLLISFYKDSKKTIKSFKKAWKSLNNILPQFLGIICIVGIMLSFFDKSFISKIIGSESGTFGVVISGIIGSITLIPGFVAFPTAKTLLDSGAGYTQIGVFISTLMMVGVVTLPVESAYFGKKTALLRNFMAVILSFIAAYFIGKVAGGIWF